MVLDEPCSSRRAARRSAKKTVSRTGNFAYFCLERRRRAKSGGFAVCGTEKPPDFAPFAGVHSDALVDGSRGPRIGGGIETKASVVVAGNRTAVRSLVHSC